MRAKIIEIIINTQANCVGKDCNKCSYSGQEHCLINRVADALLESNLIKDNKVYKPVPANTMNTMRRCTKCNGEFLHIAYNYCPKCGAKIKED